MTHHTEQVATRYGTRQSPLAIEQARSNIREDFLRFAGLVMDQVALPEGHAFAKAPAFDLNHQLTWFSGCEIESSAAGLSVFGVPIVSDEGDESQLRVEVRYFHPELHYRPTNRRAQQISRQYNEGFSAHLWVEQGRPFWGMHQSLIAGNQFCRNLPSPEALADEVVTRLRHAIARRVVQEVDTSLAG